ncbi:type II toxin-antitoxin system VapC family toxin [Rhodoferax sp.]|uniref:type II toxin-antitoxin system VapC family toxin n=1 Tax=Rhodoferax sp. TaxID=50421 RepID=UPI00275E7D62|nr:hypothetical protein [Rhodoferax sp.]
MKVALIDAGPLVATFDRADPCHARYDALLGDPGLSWRLYTTWPCIVEASHLLGALNRLELLKWVALGGVHVFPFDASALIDMTGWMFRYTQTPRSEMDLADASLYWVACETGILQILTLDVRDFSRYRLPDGRAFEIL